jgi:hypothetical protein
MTSLQSQPDIDTIEDRPNLYYNKYTYRARVTCPGVALAWYYRTPDNIKDLVKKYRKRYVGVNPQTISDISKWTKDHRDKKLIMARFEHNTASVFSDDLELLKTLEQFNCPIMYSKAVVTVPSGVKHFVNAPVYKHRLYLKNKKVTEDFRNKLRNFIQRYEGTSTVIIPSKALKQWLVDLNATNNNNAYIGAWGLWKKNFCQDSFFIDYNEESVVTMFALMFNNMVSKTYRLEKRPDTV